MVSRIQKATSSVLIVVYALYNINTQLCMNSTIQLTSLAFVSYINLLVFFFFFFGSELCMFYRYISPASIVGAVTNALLVSITTARLTF